MASQPEIDLPLHPRQGQAFLSSATEILYGGAAGGGKSYLFRVAAIAWCLQIPGLQVYLFRREFPDLWKNHMTGSGSFPELLAPLVKSGHAKINANDKVIKFPHNGSAIHLCHCQYEKDVYGYQGAEIHVLIIDELTQWPVSMYRYLRGRVRLGGLKIPDAFIRKVDSLDRVDEAERALYRKDGDKYFLELFPRVLTGANPGGIGHNWVKGGFIDIATAGDIVVMPKEEGGMRRQFIPALLEDNPTLVENDPGYELRLEGLGSKELVKAMRHGNWNIVAGGAFDDVWVEARVVVPRFEVPVSWAVDRSHDWGSSKPFANLWTAEADGTEATLPDGRKFCPPRGSLIVCHEWYGSKAPNEGVKISPRDVALGIVEREASLVQGGWVKTKPRSGPADNSISAEPIPGQPTIAKEMGGVGIYWTASDKSPGSRKTGLELMRARLTEAGKDRPEAPALFVMDHCRGLISRLPVLPRDKKNPDDVDSAAEDHDYDALRYRVLATKASVTSIRMGTAQ